MNRITLALLILPVVVAGCTSARHRAPVEERGGLSTPPVVATAPTPPAAGSAGPDGAASAPATEPPAPPAPGTYVIKPGDTLIRIGLETGQNWRDIARWNDLDNPNVLEVGQALRVVPPEAQPGMAVAQPVTSSSRPDMRPLPPTGTAPPATTAPPVALAPAPAPAPEATTAGGLNWLWPAAGPVLAGFDEARSKGLAIGGQAGDPVVAAADGRVVYAGSGLRGYGNLVIVKHDAVYLTAYAHNQALLVKEDQVVRRGQKIAEMGSSDAQRVQLHFEIRRQGKPVDPARLLPAR